MLEARQPSRGLRLCSAVGLLAKVLPELLEGLGVPQNRYHRYDVLTHGFRACDEAPAGNRARQHPPVPDRIVITLDDLD